MKLTIMLILVAILQGSAKTSAQTVTYTGKPASLQQMFALIKEQTDFRVFYRAEDLANANPVTVQLNNTPLQSAMEMILAGQMLEFEIQGRTIFINKKEPAPLADIRGIVVNEKQEPVPGVTIYARRIMRATVTSEKGEFSLSGVMEGDTIMFSSINYETQNIPAVTKSFMRVQLKPRITNLDLITVLNTGYQVLSKERATGSFGKADMEIFAKRTGTMDVIARLEGQIPGMRIVVGGNSEDVNTNGSGVSLRKSEIRGLTSRYPSPPLYVLNGVIVADLSAVNPDDIEDITVLKDAAAAAIWGARSSNGVVVITTKSGNKNQRLSVNYSGFINVGNKPDFNYAKMLDSRQYIDVAKELFDPVANAYRSQTFFAPHDRILYDQYLGRITAVEANRKLDSLASISNLSQIKDIWYRNAMTTNHTVSVSGGNTVYSFYGSFGYTGSQSTTPGSMSNAYKLNLTQSINPGKRVRISVNTSLVNTITKSKRPVSVNNSFLPYQLFRDASGKSLNLNYMNGYLDSVSRIYEAQSGISLGYNPIDEMDYGNNNVNNLSINVTANASVNIWKGLNFNGTYGYQKAPGSGTSYLDNKALSERKQQLNLTVINNGLPEYLYPRTGGRYTMSNTDQRNWTVRNQLIYDAPFRKGQDHLTLQAGQEVQEGVRYGSTTTLFGYDEALTSYSILDYARLRQGIFPTVTGFGSLAISPYTVKKEVTRFISYFGLASYSFFDGKYNVDASLRQDYSNMFASEISSQNDPAWSFGARWWISKEKFLSKAKWLNDLSIRTTYGITGNSPYANGVSQNDVLSSVTIKDVYDHPLVGGNAYTLSDIANKTLAWERTNNLNIGLDFSVLKRRLSGGIDYYTRTTTNMLGSTPLNPFSGYTGITGNLGKMVNKGIELSLRSENIRTKNFSWTTSFTIGHNQNKLVSFSKPSAANLINVSFRMNGTIPVLGYPMGAIWAYQFAGLDNMGDPQIYLANKSITKAYNVVKVEDLKYMGTTTPTATGGFSNTFSYDGISLSLNMIYNMGSVMYRPVNTLYTGKLVGNSLGFSNGNIRDLFLDRWKKPGDEAFTNTPSYVFDGLTSQRRRNVGYYTAGDINVVSASYIKLRDITLSYSLKPNVLRFMKIRSANVFVQTNNFLVWAANKDGIDPEYGGSVPASRHNYSLGLSLSL
ncbi:SusC/RagA family TonB-linked outer membrane protein [Chitinophaga sp. SYP-B3965]|uniref:SusC/RagA family TonB-linked outer membrane protein n=1 Tax=Chitinophaga sp. SYP-B3965 TaxID=2663120 RepID=UPI00156647AA|nr:SusC/RagA family TonB-linked outer membrane protein [Chitinophaga sp. SYP-B3965]